jgi:hypothetical protein
VCLRQRLLPPPVARMEPPQRRVSPLESAPAKAAIASRARRTKVPQSRHRPSVRSAGPSSRKHQCIGQAGNGHCECKPQYRELEGPRNRRLMAAFQFRQSRRIGHFNRRSLARIKPMIQLSVSDSKLCQLPAGPTLVGLQLRKRTSRIQCSISSWRSSGLGSQVAR